MKQEPNAAVLELLLADAADGVGDRGVPQGVVVGALAGFDETGRPRVELPNDAPGESTLARTVVALSEGQVGSQVVLAFERGDVRNPIVMGVLRPADTVRLQAEEDPETLLLSARKEIVLRCGRASVTLTRAGKILLRGAYLLSRSSGANRIKGGSVQIN